MAAKEAGGGGGFVSVISLQFSLVSGVIFMTFDQFTSYLDMLFNSVIGLIRGGEGG